MRPRGARSGGKAWLWVAVTALFTVFTIARNRSAAVARAVLGTREGPIAVTDRWSAYDWIAGSSRQVCWSHLRRDFQAMIDRGGAAEPIGRQAVAPVGSAVPMVASPRC